ncbi:hypothetical protein JCM9279_005075 [Rhodotorula babjevae]
MSATQPQPCVICGTPTKNRCSSCAKAGVDLFFCTREHQQLVWKVHRTVCGPGKANPLFPPPLLEDELPAILDTLHLEIPYDDFKRDITTLTATQASQAVRRGKITLARGMAVMWSLPVDDFPMEMITSYVEPRRAVELVDTSTACAWLLVLRRYIYKHARIPNRIEAIHHFSACYVAATLEVALDGPDDVASATMLRHRLLLLAAVLQTVPPPPPHVIIAATQQLVDSVKSHLVYQSFN